MHIIIVAARLQNQNNIILIIARIIVIKWIIKRANNAVIQWILLSIWTVLILQGIGLILLNKKKQQRSDKDRNKRREIIHKIVQGYRKLLETLKAKIICILACDELCTSF